VGFDVWEEEEEEKEKKRKRRTFIYLLFIFNRGEVGQTRDQPATSPEIGVNRSKV